MANAIAGLINKYTRPEILNADGTVKLRKFVPSPQQAQFIHWVATGKGSTLLKAVAGAGKSTTLAEAIRYMFGGVYVCAFNRKIADEFTAKLEGMGIDWKTAQANTFHGYGLRFFKKAYPGVKVDGNKCKDLMDELVRDHKNPLLAAVLKSFCLDMVSLAKQSAFGVITAIDDTAEWFKLAEHHDLFEDLPEGVDPSEAISMAIALLKKSNALCATVIDFDDMIYAPLFCRVKIWQNPWVLVDEAQDTNTARRILAARMLKPGGRLVAVGDDGQAIYGFTGADADSMNIIAKEFNAGTLPLTVTYRCPRKVVAFAQQWVSHIEAHENNPEGIVGRVDADQVLGKGNALNLGADDVIICRNTKPLVEIAYSFIRNGLACYVEGREIGNGLIKLASKWKIKTLAQLSAKLEQHRETQYAKFMAKGQETQAQAVVDKVETLVVLIEGLQKEGKQLISDLTAFITSLFGDTKDGERPRCLTLCTGHKSKGREWKRVFWLNRETTIPSKYARKAWQLQQEENLAYVIATRAMEELYEFSADM